MGTYVMTKDFTNAKIKTQAKIDITSILIDALKDKLGEDAVSMIRTRSGQSFTNEIGVVFGTVDKNGEELPLVITINPTVKEFEDRKTAKKVYVPFDFAEAKAEYEEYLADKEDKTAGSSNKSEDVAKRKSANENANENTDENANENTDENDE